MRGIKLPTQEELCNKVNNIDYKEVEEEEKPKYSFYIYAWDSTLCKFNFTFRW